VATALYFLIPVALAAVAVVLGLGFHALIRGGDFARRRSNVLMRWRVALQATALVLVLAFVWVSSR